ncbi:hypothetical protein JCM11491_000809 [Sporobolomyces phaffii]
MRVSAALLLAGATTAVLASHSEPTSHHLEARDPTFGLVHGIIGGLLGGGHSSVRYPSKYWKCNGRGNDGWQYDCYGNSRPAHIPYGWAYFGVEIGWAPTASWSCSSSFQFSAEFLAKAHLVTWWTPSLAWKKHNVGIDLGVNIIHWGLLPSRGWKCNGSGKDGYYVDWQGSRPSWVPVGWLWFGEAWGWMPGAGLDISIGVDLPAFFLPKAHLCTWWSPSAGWLSHNIGLDFGVGVKLPSWGFELTRPSPSWQCNGSGKDGWSVDHHGNGRPSWAPEGWFWFGISIGWQPSKHWNCPISFIPPVEWQNTCGKAPWWVPSTPWVNKHHGHNWHFGFRPPKHWGCEVPSTPSLPPAPPVKVTTTTSVVKHTTTSAKPKTTTHKATTTVKPSSPTTHKPKPSSSSSTSLAHPITTSKPKPKPTGGNGNGNGNVTVTKTVTKIVTVPTGGSGGGGGSCGCEEASPYLPYLRMSPLERSLTLGPHRKQEPYRLARRNKARQSSD